MDGSMVKEMLGKSVVVENSSFVSTGKISYLDGDILEIEITSWKNFSLGEKVKAVIYARGGLVTFETSVVGKSHGVLIVLVPPDWQPALLQRRQHVRVPWGAQGELLQIVERRGVHLLDNPEPIVVENISLGGIGFRCGQRLLDAGTIATVRLPIEQFPPVPVMVLHGREENDGRFHGGRFLELPQKQIQTLRAFLLNRQVWMRLQERRAEKID